MLCPAIADLTPPARHCYVCMVVVVVFGVRVPVGECSLMGESLTHAVVSGEPECSLLCCECEETKSRNQWSPIPPMSYCHVAPMRYGAVA